MAKVSAGGYDLNKWLSGGYDKDVITTLFGGPGSGKTNMCMLAAVSQAKKGNKVIYVDTEGGFSSERVKQLVENANNGEMDYKKVLENVFVLSPTNFDEQKKDFDKLLKYLDNHISLIVVDGMTMLYRLDFADAREKSTADMQKTNAELVRQLRLLAEIARKQNIPILITNQTYNWEDEKRMVAGDILKYWSKCLIEVENDRGTRRIHLRKHRSLPEKSMTFQIWDGGVRKRGWI